MVSGDRSRVMEERGRLHPDQNIFSFTAGRLPYRAIPGVKFVESGLCPLYMKNVIFIEVL